MLQSSDPAHHPNPCLINILYKVHVKGVILITGLKASMLAPTNFALRTNLLNAIIFANNNQGSNRDVTFKDVQDKPGGTKDRCLVTFYFATASWATGNATSVLLRSAVSSGALATKFNTLASLSGALAVTISTESSTAIHTEAIVVPPEQKKEGSRGGFQIRGP